MKILEDKWVNFICKQYRKYYPDPLDNMGRKLISRVFESKTDVFNFMRDNSIGGLKTIMRIAEMRIRIRKGDDENDGSRDK